MRLKQGPRRDVWSHEKIQPDTNSQVLDLRDYEYVKAFGKVSAATTLTLMLSDDQENWVAGPKKTLKQAGVFSLGLHSSYRFIALRSSNLVVATGTIQAEGI